VEASTGSGSIKVDGAASLEASTGSGSITAAAVAGPTKASSGSGSITITQSGKGDVTVSASSAASPCRHRRRGPPEQFERRHQDRRAPRRPVGAALPSGGITITVPPDAAFDLDARTNSGTIDSAHPVTMEVTGRIDKRRVQGKVRGGGPLIEASCSSARSGSSRTGPSPAHAAGTGSRERVTMSGPPVSPARSEPPIPPTSRPARGTACTRPATTVRKEFESPGMGPGCS